MVGRFGPDSAPAHGPLPAGPGPGQAPAPGTAGFAVLLCLDSAPNGRREGQMSINDSIFDWRATCVSVPSMSPLRPWGCLIFVSAVAFFGPAEIAE